MVTGDSHPPEPNAAGTGEGDSSRPDATLADRAGALIRAVREGDDAMVERVILGLSARHRALAPLAFAVGGFVMLWGGIKLLFSNWRLTLVQVLPAMWIWLAMYDLKAHVLHDKTFHLLRGPILIPVVLLIAAITAASFYLNAIFAFAIVQPGIPRVRPAAAQARSHLAVILAWGLGVGVLLGLATMVAARWGHPWFTLSLSIVIGVMMVCYVAVPSRLIGGKPKMSRRDKLAASAVGGALGAVVCTPPYLLGRIGLLMLGSSVLLIPGIIVFAIGITLQAGATGAVKTVKMSAKLRPAEPVSPAIADAGPAAGAPAREEPPPASATPVPAREETPPARAT